MTHRPFEIMAEANLDVVTKSGSEWMCACPYCGRNASLQFNVVKGLWNCFACGQGGHAKALIKHLGGAYHAPGVDLEALQRNLNDLGKEPEEKRILPESFLARFGGRPHEYWTKKRGFSHDTIKAWGLGFDPLGPRLGQERVGPSCTIPFRDLEGGLLGVFFRRLGDGFPRYIYPRGFDRVGSLFGQWNLHDYEGAAPLVLVEGSLDAIRVHRRDDRYAVAQYGSSLSSLQVQVLRRCGVREVTLFYDYDIAGVKATKQAPQELDGFIVRSVQWDEEKYCWHGKVCGCPLRHKPLDHDFGSCKRRVPCRCGRVHDMDPGGLTAREIDEMLESAELVGRRPLWKRTGLRATWRGAKKKATGS